MNYLDLVPESLRGKTWSAAGMTLTDTHLAKVVENLHVGDPPYRGVDMQRSGRRFDRAAQLLRKAGVIEYDRHKTRWVLSEATLERIE